MARPAADDLRTAHTPNLVRAQEALRALLNLGDTLNDRLREDRAPSSEAPSRRRPRRLPLSELRARRLGLNAAAGELADLAEGILNQFAEPDRRDA